MPLEILTGYTTNVAGVNTRVTMFGEDSNVVRTGVKTENIILLDMWAMAQSDVYGVWNVRSPRMHDNVNGIQMPMSRERDDRLPLFPLYQRLITQDNLNIFMNTNVGEDEYANCHLLIYYEDLPSSQGNFITYEEAKNNLHQIMTLVHTITPTSHVDYSGGEVITTDQDEFDALKNYAFLGFKTYDEVDVSALCLRGHNTGNLRIGQPCTDSCRFLNRPYFIDMAKKSGLPIIPVINAANKDNTFIDCAGGTAFEAIKFYSYWLQLG